LGLKGIEELNRIRHKIKYDPFLSMGMFGKPKE
jgi:hypothetical protein